MNGIFSWLVRSRNKSYVQPHLDVEDDEMLYSKNNVCVHPAGGSGGTGVGPPHHTPGYLTVTAQPDAQLGHTLLLSWRPNQLMTRTGGRPWSRSVSENATRDARLAVRGDVTLLSDADDVRPPREWSGASAGQWKPDSAPAVSAASSPAGRLELPAAEEVRRLSTQSAPPSPRSGIAPDVPAVLTADLGRTRSVRVFLTPDDPGCGQLVLCSRQSRYRILHFHHGGLRRLVTLFERWSHLLGGGGAGDDGGCLLFSVCSPLVEEGEQHPEEGLQPCLTPELWPDLVTLEGAVRAPDELMQMVFFGGLDERLRPLVWPLLLGVNAIGSTEAEREERRAELEREYERISELPERLEGAARDEFHRLVTSTVDKDVVRTDPANPFFCGRANPNVQTLRRILLGFAAANPALGYTQGMSDLLAPLLETLGQPAAAYWALDALLKRSASVISPRDDVMDRQLACLRELLRLLTPELYQHLAAVEDGLELLFAHRWLLLCFRREFPEPTALRIWEACWSCPTTRHFCLFVCVAVCAAYGADVTSLSMNADAVLLHFTSLSQHMDGDVILRKARGLLHRFLSLESVPCTLATLCSGDGGGPWDLCRVTTVQCRGHPDGRPCPAAAR
ncbi:TBC1 domain family member 16-like [Pollicipes pollicipes]|uniref:TBC1 domain family member 16-like n=1 Tax=Pollicipes pollicipes TaxID=41117 RepID=UPI0018849DAF|nr:TBC1 domain family member 16-like [Pollicipes pollicipes]